MKYILSIDQSTQGTKAFLFDETGCMVEKADLPHKQYVNEKGWVSHDLTEIYENVLKLLRGIIEKAGVEHRDILGLGISNQRETSCCFSRETGEPLDKAIVWQCSRSASICEEPEIAEKAEAVHQKTGLNLSPYFPASKYTWFLRNIPGAADLQADKKLCFGTVDTYLVYRLTGGKSFKTDYSNASRTQLLNLSELRWDPEIVEWFGILPDSLPEICGSDTCFGYTDLDGYLQTPIPIHGVLGDSHAALFGNGCLKPGMVKATYGTGSSVMMNIGENPVIPQGGVVGSIAWGMKGKVLYVLEGNINYAAAVVTWLKDDLGLISDPGETEALASSANPEDTTYLIPAFSGLGAPYWKSEAKAMIYGMTRTTGKKEIVKAALESVAFQICDILELLKQESGISPSELRTDGGPTRNRFLMQFQSDMSGMPVCASEVAELSGTGAAYMAGMGLDMYDMSILEKLSRTAYVPAASPEWSDNKRKGWREALEKVTG